MEMPHKRIIRCIWGSLWSISETWAKDQIHELPCRYAIFNKL